MNKAEFVQSGFSTAHLAGSRFRGYRVPSTLLVELRSAVRAGEPFVYAYYDGIDKVSHEYGLGEHYDAELQFVDGLVAGALEVLPAGTALIVTADHGQVHVGDRIIEPHPDVLANVSFQSGEGRFRWLHARPGRSDALFEAAQAHADTAWVVTRDQTIDEGWWGPVVSDAARQRLGDVALVAREPVSFHDAADSGPYELIGRHGSLTPDEMYVPLLVGVAPMTEFETQVAHGELVAHGGDAVEPAEAEERREAVEEPAKVMRIGSMIKQLLDEVRSAELDDKARIRLKEIYDSSIQEVGAALSPDLRAELERVAIPFGDAAEPPSDAELRIAQAQLVGWLEGLFHGIQATLFAQQMAARNQLEEIRRQLPPGAMPGGPGGGCPGAPAAQVPGRRCRRHPARHLPLGLRREPGDQPPGGAAPAPVGVGAARRRGAGGGGGPRPG